MPLNKENKKKKKKKKPQKTQIFLKMSNIIVLMIFHWKIFF